MSSPSDKLIRDGSVEFSGGQDAGRSPSIIARNQVALGTNCSMRGGYISPRPAWVRVEFEYATGIRSAFRESRFQHASFFDGSGSPMLLSAHGGRLFKADLIRKTITEITPNTKRNTETTAQFVIPAVGATVNITMASTYKMLPTIASGVAIDDVPLTVGGYALELTAVTSGTQITVTNRVLANVGVTVAAGSSVEYTYMDTNSESQWQGWSVQAENYWIYQDNQSLPIIFNGSVARRSVPGQKEVPVGNVMAYTMGRLCVALRDRTSYRIGDLVFSSSGTATAGYRDSMLKFTENDYLNEGGDLLARVFGAPSGYGPITSMKALSMLDQQLGQGPLLVGTPFVVFTVNLPFDRTTWQATANPIQTVTPIVGPVGQTSTTNINSDMWYRGTDGAVHSFVLARRDFQTWGNSPQSTELGRTLSYDTPWMLEYGSAVYFDNRRLELCSPVNSAYGVWHRGLSSLDFNLMSSLRERTNPAWEGIWSGVRILQLVVGTVNQKEHCYAYILNDSNEIEIWELDKDAIADNNEEDIEWTVNYRSYNFGDGFQLKRLEGAELFVDDVRGDCTMAMKYRSDQNPCWQTWDTQEFCAQVTDCGPFTCTGPKTYREQFRSKLRLHKPTDTFDTINGRRYRTGYEFQPRMEATGHFRVKQFRLVAADESETSFRDTAVQP